MVRPVREEGSKESRFLRSHVHYWWVVLLSVALFAAGGYGLSFIMTPSSRSTAGVAYDVRPYLNAGLGALLGLGLGVGLVSLLRRPGRVVKDQSAIGEELDLAILASVPAVGKWGRGAANGRRGIGFGTEKELLLVASRALVASLKRRGFGRTIKVLLVVGADSGEGTSATAVNLALSMAVAGDRVILVDCDLWHSSLDRYLQVDNHRGLSDVLLGSAMWRDAVLPVDVARLSGCDVLPARDRDEARVAANLYCLTSGSELEGHPAILAGKKMRWLLKELASITDYVILDCPPLFLTPDVLDLADEADGILVVSRLGAHSVDEMRRLSQVLAGVRGKTLGVVVTDAKLKAGPDSTALSG